eukprot:CAMPEP_0185857870 /NCGR_PEP_ID=MMETSP1354-20130828/29723_1 /TAXON_ID=708628 /ORGANISM="Erythrolobus madagascarensis, Strain CCMP3276" /LENGTH=790 /DNA_ID=CAMNT_0028560143 /DNA_START=422 /DNA_END=2794 /DNA_ORIENTATION=+
MEDVEGLLAMSSVSRAAVADVVEPSSTTGQVVWYLSWLLVVCVVMLAFAALLVYWTQSQPEGSSDMQDVARPIRQGAAAFLKVQYSTIALLAVCMAALIFVGYALFGGAHANMQATLTAGAFLLGGSCSAASGAIAMWASVRSNVRVTQQAAAGSYTNALLVAFRGGAFAAVLIVTLCLFGLVVLVCTLAVVLQIPITRVPLMMVGYGFGASFVALFAQLGGGIYTKAADVGSDIVGKTELGLPEDDPRNAAVVADLVGDNVGDCAGRGADLFESIAAENIGAMILAAVLARSGGLSPQYQVSLTLLPLVLHAVGLLSSFVGIACVYPQNSSSSSSSTRGEATALLSAAETGARADDDGDLGEDPMHVMRRGFLVTFVVALIGTWIVCAVLLGGIGGQFSSGTWALFASCASIGLLTSVAFAALAEYYTDYWYAPVRSISRACESGHGVAVIQGISVGLESVALPILVLAVAILTVFGIGSLAAGATSTAKFVRAAGMFGTAMGTCGMLSTATFVLAMDVFGPIGDNAGGIAEMSEQTARTRAITDRLDAVGNTTKALTKGYAVGSAGLAAFLLFQGYIDSVNARLAEGAPRLGAIDLSVPELFVAGLLGCLLVFLFSSLAIRAVGRAASSVVDEVREQISTRPGIMTREETPDYARCVRIVTQAALRQMILPGLLAVLAPAVVGITFRVVGGHARPLLGAQAMGAMLLVGTIAGIAMALFANNSGGSLDNAKKLIETGQYGGKNSEAHKAAVTGDTVGDPLKDTAGPSLHVLIKLLATVTLVVAPLLVT